MIVTAKSIAIYIFYLFFRQFKFVRNAGIQLKMKSNSFSMRCWADSAARINEFLLRNQRTLVEPQMKLDNEIRLVHIEIFRSYNLIAHIGRF